MSRLGKRFGLTRLQRFYIALSLAVVLLVTGTKALAQSFLTRHVREAVVDKSAPLLNRLRPTKILRLDLVLPLRDQVGLDNFLQELYDPSSPSYRQFLTVSEFTERFGPTQEDYDEVIRFINMNDLKVVGGSRDGMDIQVEGSVANIETTFHVSLKVYKDLKKHRTFYATDREPTVDLPFPLWHISGLDNYSVPRPHYIRRNKNLTSNAATGSGPSNAFLGSDMRAAYYGGSTLTGAGQNLGLLEFYGTNLQDLTTYYSNIGQSNKVPVTLLSTDGTSTSCVYPGCDDTEQTLDMTQALGMAPGLASLVMYIGNTDTAIFSALTTHTPLPTTIGCSWGWTPADPTTLNPYWQKMASQGQTFFAASGDSSNWSASNEAWPADTAYVVSVGGSELITNGPGGSWVSETAWSNSGGGISPNYIAIPPWQQLPTVINSSNRGSTTLRNGPDVAANANSTFYVCANQTACTANHYGGTSFAAPMWAAYVALANQQAVTKGQPLLGYINPTLYSLGGALGNGTNFHDITIGQSSSYQSVVGYDLLTGWGSMNGANLINTLVPGATNDFDLSTSLSALTIPVGNSSHILLTNTINGEFKSAVTLTTSSLPTGVSANFAPASITGNGTSNLTLTTSPTTAPGTYPVTIYGASGSLVQSTQLTLTVTAAAVGNFMISAMPSLFGVTLGNSTSSVISNTSYYGFSSPVNLSVSGLPSGVTATFSPSSITGTGRSILSLKTNTLASRGFYLLSILGAGGGLTNTTTAFFFIY
jgi:subtilase family serine protease